MNQIKNSEICTKIKERPLKRGHGTLPLKENQTISLQNLETELQQEPSITINNPTDTEEKRRYLSISFNWKNNKNSINIYPNGKLECWFLLPNKALSFYIDFLYYSIIINCLGEKEL